MIQGKDTIEWRGRAFFGVHGSVTNWWGWVSQANLATPGRAPKQIKLGEFGPIILQVCRGSLGLSTIKVWAMPRPW